MREERRCRRHTLREMARVGRAGRYEIRVYGGEGHIPHFHFKDTQTGREGCARLDAAAYFPHGRYTAALNAGERAELVKFLRSAKEPLGITQFQYICVLWNDNNPRTPLRSAPRSTPMPDYENMR